MARDVPMNATLVKRFDMHHSLMIIRVVPDGPLFSFEPGQYTVLGLPGSAERVEFSDREDKPPPPDKLIRRAYSISSSSRQGEYIEFYISLVQSGKLTPRLFQLAEGDRLWLGHKATGHFTLDDVIPENDLLMISTGTGLAPFVAMVRTALHCDTGRHFVVIHGARYSWDLGYRSEFEALDRCCSNLTYIPTVTRVEKDTSWKGHAGRVHTVLEDGLLEERAGFGLDPARLSVFLCGNPAMVDQMQVLLEGKGFTLHTKKEQGNLHVEKYW